MPISDSMFLFQVTADSLQSFIDCKGFIVRCHLNNYFTLTLRDPNEIPKEEDNKINKLRKSKAKRGLLRKYPCGQVILTASGEDLLAHVKENKVELSLWSKTSPETKLGASPLPWSQVFINFLKQWRFEPPPAKITHKYFIYDSEMSTRIAAITLTMKMGVLQHKIMHRQFKKPAKKIRKAKTEVITEPTDRVQSSVKLDVDLKAEDDSTLVENMYCHLSNESKINFVKSSTLLSSSPVNELSWMVPFRSRSHSTLMRKSQLTTLKHVFGDYHGPFGDRVYYVGYVQVANNQDASDKSTKSRSKPSNESPTLSPISTPTTPGEDTACSVDTKCNTLEDLILLDCKDVKCENKCYRHLPDIPNKPILLDITKIKKELCCVTAKLDPDEDPCFCSCECTFGYEKKTTYCRICGGFEKAGEEFRLIPAGELPFPCPVYHKLIDKNKLRGTGSGHSSHHDSRGSSNKGRGSKGSSKTSQKGSKGSDKSDKKKTSNAEPPEKGKKRKSTHRNSVEAKTGSKKADTSATGKKEDPKKLGGAGGPSAGAGGGKSDVESEKDKKTKKKKENKFKFNYGYQGIPPKIGHAHCFDPCTGSLYPVPKDMGWLWTAEDIPGLKFRPNWRPGATHKTVVKLLKQAKNPGLFIGKKKKRDTQLTKKKRPLKRPLLIVNKKDGEFSITLEQMKDYGTTRMRSINLPPFEDKAPLTFNIGRTEEENFQRMKKKLRVQRRLERAQRMFIQNTFQDLCHEICLKTYQQAVGILPNAEDPECKCLPAIPDPSRVDVNVSCSCSEHSSDPSDTDSDEWLMEFTPPNCYFKPTAPQKKHLKVDNDTQYTYMDYRVKLLDKNGKEVPRFFIGPNGKQVCGDLGGFQDSDGKWLLIGIDGFVSPDGRWAPHAFTGPNGEAVDTEDGKFTGSDGVTYTVGVDGYIVNGKWKCYAKSRTPTYKGKYKDVGRSKDVGQTKEDSKNKDPKVVEKEKDKKDKDKNQKPTEVVKQPTVDSGSQCDFSCFGTTSPRVLSEMGIRGHGHDRKLLLATLQKMLSRGINVKIPEDPYARHRARLGKPKPSRTFSSIQRDYYAERTKCRHPEPSPKGVICHDDYGRTVYFKLRNLKNPRPKQRVECLSSQGKSVSSFHIPCFDSFMNSEMLKQQVHEKVKKSHHKSGDA